MRFYRLRPQERHVLKMINGRTSYSDIQQSLHQQFPGMRVTMEAIFQLVYRFETSGLLLSSSSRQTERLADRLREQKRANLVSRLLNPFTVKFPGIDPSRLLDRLSPIFGWLFSRFGLAVTALFALSAIALLTVNWQVAKWRLPDANAFFALDNLIHMAILLMFTKTIHELGHALCCRRLGGECHEIGLLLMVMTPAMYCNTSDSWTLPNKWHRIAIGAAGMYVELILASIATYVWWYSEPGWVHYTALNIMFLSSVATIGFNANPLLRYDGYFMLADYLEIPNLAQKSKQLFSGFMRRWFFGLEPEASGSLPQGRKWTLICYSLLSFCYRWIVTCGILWFVSSALEPYGLAIIGQALVGLAAIGMFVPPAIRLVQFLRIPGRIHQLKVSSCTATAFVLLISGSFLYCVPFPHNVSAYFVIEPLEAEKLYLNVDGRLAAVYAREGAKLASGDLVAVFENPELQLEHLALKSERAKLKAQVDRLELVLQRDVDVSHLLVQAHAEIQRVEAELAASDRRLRQLELRASRAGTLIAARNVIETYRDDQALETWSGNPFDLVNEKCFLKRETHLGYVGECDRWEVKLFVNECDISLVNAGQQVQMKPHSSPRKRMNVKVSSVSKNEVHQLPRELLQTNGGPFAMKLDNNGNEVPMLKVYESKASLLADQDTQMLVGMKGCAKIRVGSATIFQRVWRFLHTLFHF